MSFFAKSELVSLHEVKAEDAASSADIQSLQAKLASLHLTLYTQLRTYNLDLHLLDIHKPVLWGSVAGLALKETLAVQYLRTKGQAVIVERLMGREEVASVQSVQAHRHPVIEMRLTPQHFTLELVISPDAWWDQQNLLGKLTLARHRQTFYSFLRSLTRLYRTGFWSGSHLSPMHLNGAQFQHPRIMEEWMSTFEPNSDWFRMGIWYELDHDLLTAELIEAETFKQLRKLYELYQFTLWTGDNNYREFHKKKN